MMDVHQTYYSDLMMFGSNHCAVYLELGQCRMSLVSQGELQEKKRKRDLENDKFCIVLFIFNTKYFIESSYNLTFSNGYNRNKLVFRQEEAPA